MKTESDFLFKVTKNSHMVVRWARKSNKNKANITHHFSVDYYVDNILIQTINSLCLRDTVSRKTQQTITHIGSMNKSIGQDNPKTIYSNTFFPVDSYDDATQEEIAEQNAQVARRTTFVENVSKAINAFIEYHNSNTKSLVKV